MFLFVPPLSRLSPSPNLVGGPGLPGLSLLTGTQVWGFSVWLILAAGRGRLTRYQQGKDIQPSLGQPTSGGCISMKHWYYCHFVVTQKSFSVDNFANKHYWPGCLFNSHLQFTWDLFLHFQESKLQPVLGCPLDRRRGGRRVLVQLTSTHIPAGRPVCSGDQLCGDMFMLCLGHFNFYVSCYVFSLTLIFALASGCGHCGANKGLSSSSSSSIELWRWQNRDNLHWIDRFTVEQRDGNTPCYSVCTGERAVVTYDDS